MKVQVKRAFKKKLNLFIFTHAPKQNSPPWQKEITHSSWKAFSEDLFFPQQKLGEGWRGGGVGGNGVVELKKLPKLNLRGYWSFDRLPHLYNLYIIGFCFVP